MGEPLTISVLVVDDDEVDREAVRRALRKLEVKVIEAASGADALAQLRALEGPALMLLDINMPDMDGFAVLDEVRADSGLAGTIVFMLTSSSRDADVEAAYSRHVAGFLIKGDLGSRLEHLASLISAYQKAVRLPA